MKLFSRFAALALALALCLSILPAAVAEETPASAVQIPTGEVGGTVFYNDKGDKVEGATALGGDAVVEMTKTVAGTNTENEFEITLQVKTTSRIDEIGPVSQDAAVLLIIDLSSSMDDLHMTETTNNRPYYNYITRLDAAKEAANNFIEDFAKLGGSDSTGKRMVGLITFGTHAQPQPWSESVFWIDVHNSTNLNTVKTKINSLNTYQNYDSKNNYLGLGGTNMEAALMLGRNMLEDGLGSAKDGKSGAIKDIKHVYTIFLTDGVPTFHVQDADDNTFIDITGTTGQINGVAGGVDKTTELDVRDVGLVANGSIDGKTKGITDYSKLYSICFGKNNNGTDIYSTSLKPAKSNNNQNGGNGHPGPDPTPNPAEDYWAVTIQKTGYKIAGTVYPENKNETNVVRTVGEWLSSFSSAKAYNAQTDNMSGLFSSFNSILTHIKLSAQAWQVDDKMGENIEFIAPIEIENTASSNPGEKLDNKTTLPSDENSNTLHWNLLSSEPDPNITDIKTGENETSIVGYTYKYKVRLNNLDGAYEPGTTTPTNASATLKYAVLKDGVFQANPNNTTDGTYTGIFLQPKVKGFVGNLQFTKVGNGAPLAGATFTLSSVEKKADGTPKWTATATSTTANENNVTFSSIPSGHHYTLTETSAPAGYTAASPIDLSVSYRVVDYTNFSGMETAPTVVNTAKTGSLTITKTFSGLPAGTVPALSFAVTGPNNYSPTISLSEMTLENGVYSTTISGLPVGTYYVSESATAVTDYTLSSTTVQVNGSNATPDNSGKVSATVTSGNTTTVAFTNSYSRDMGSLTVSKAWAYMLGTQATPAPSNAPSQVTVNVVGPTSTSAILNAENNWSTTIPNLPVGSYTVTEDQTGLAIEGWTLDVTGGNPSTSPAPVTKGTNTTAATITNTYSRDTGSLTVRKENEGATPASVTFTVTGSDGYNTEVTLTATNGWTTTLENLPTGTYTIEEQPNSANVAGYTYTVSYEQTGKTENANTVNITKGATVAVTATNTYTKVEGGLTISKAFNFQYNGNATAAPAPTPTLIQVEVAPAASNGPTVSMTPFPVDLTANNNWSATVTNLPVGDYTVTEKTDGAQINGWTLTTPAPTTVTVASNTTAPSVMITNTYNRETGSLTIKKEFTTSPETTARPTEITVNVSGYATPIKLNAANGWTYTIENLPTGTYTVAEDTSTAAITDYTLTGTTYTDNATVTIDKGSKITVTITNTYTQNKGGLTISKAFSFVTPSPMVGTVTTPAPSDRPEIVVEVKNASNQPVATAALNSGNGWSASITDLPVGVYTVTEVNSTEHPLAINGWSLNAVDPVEVTVSTDPAEVTITNTYTRETGSLTITKAISGLPEGTPAPNITFTLTGPVSTTIPLSTLDKNNDGVFSTTLDNLPAGEYTVTETNAAVMNYSLSATVSVNGGTAQPLPANGVTVNVEPNADSAATVAFTNSYSSTLGSVTIKKEFSNLPESSKPKFIIIQVFGPTNSNFETTVLLNAANNWTDTIPNLPAGEYTVTENTDNAIVSGYNFTTTVKVGDDDAENDTSTKATVPAGGNLTVTFTNAYSLKEAKKIELPITKVVKRGEKGNVDPTGARTFTFVAHITPADAAAASLDTPAVQPGEIVVQFNGETLTPKDNLYTFSITVNGVGKETGTLTIFTNEVSNLSVNVRELSQIDSSYPEDECWKYDGSSYEGQLSISDDGYEYRIMHNLPDGQEEELDSLNILFTNVYTKTSTPEIEVPVTGDNSHMGLYMAMMVLSAAGVVLLLKRRSAHR